MAPQWPLWFFLLLAIIGAPQILANETEVSESEALGANLGRGLQLTPVAGVAAQAVTLEKYRKAEESSL